jgi:sensor histidine kinase YesM
MSKQRWLPWVSLVAVCTVLAILDALGSYSAGSLSGVYRYRWRDALFWDLLGWYLWIPLTPAVIWFGRRFRLDRQRWRRSVLIHFHAGLGLALLRVTVLMLINFVAFAAPRDVARFTRFLREGSFLLLTELLIGMVCYGMILASVHALDYYRQYRAEELRASQLQALLAQSQLQALKMQLHPHFLFNTLHSISALQLEDVAAAQKMTARLGDFLRLTLDNAGAQEVTLKQEMEFLKCYLDIERVRFGPRLSVHFEIAPETLDARVPNLILQPIVENAVRHGIAPQTTPGRLDITSQHIDRKLRLEVRDNGPGLGTGRAGSVYKEGLGLANTRARLEQLYGAEYRFGLHDAPDGGLVVTMEMPFVAIAANVVLPGARPWHLGDPDRQADA